MSRDRYRDAARLLDGKYRSGVPRMKAAHVSGTLEDVTYEFTWTWRVETKRTGILFQKEHNTNVRQHDYRFDYTWVDVPMTMHPPGGAWSRRLRLPARMQT